MDTDNVFKKFTNSERFLTALKLSKNLTWERGENNTENRVKNRSCPTAYGLSDWLETSSMLCFEQKNDGSIILQ